MAHVHYNKEFGALMTEALGGLSLRVAAERCSLSHTTLAGMVNGKVPRPDTLGQVADGLGVGEDLRARLFHEAGYVPKRSAAPPAMTERDEIADAVVRKLRAEGVILDRGADHLPITLADCGSYDLLQRGGKTVFIKLKIPWEEVSPEAAREILKELERMDPP